jgi:hypothetical protein
MLAVATSCPLEGLRQLLLSVAVNVTSNPVVTPPGFVSESGVLDPPTFKRLILEEAMVGATALTVSVAFVASAPPDAANRCWSKRYPYEE